MLGRCSATELYRQPHTHLQTYIAKLQPFVSGKLLLNNSGFSFPTFVNSEHVLKIFASPLCYLSELRYLFMSLAFCVYLGITSFSLLPILCRIIRAFSVSIATSFIAVLCST